MLTTVDVGIVQHEEMGTRKEKYMEMRKDLGNGNKL